MGKAERIVEVGGHEEPEIGDIVDKRFAQFGHRPMDDADLWALGMATMVMPDGNPGAEAYLMKIAGTVDFAPRLTLWGRVVAIGVAGAGYKSRGGTRRRAYVEGYDESWGRYAVADGLSIALYGEAPGLVERAEELKCGKQGYQRIRDFVGGALVVAIAEFHHALEWACGYRRDRVFEGRWEGVTGLKWDGAKTNEMMGREGKIYFPLFAPGCSRTERTPDLDDLDGVRDNGRPAEAPQTIYHALRPSDWWDEGYARLMRDAPVRMIYPATD